MNERIKGIYDNQSHKKQKKSKAKKVIMCIFLAIILIGAIMLFPIIKEYFLLTDYNGADYELNVEQGYTVNSVAQVLESDKIIHSKYSLILKYKFNSSDYGQIRAGTYTVTKGMNIHSILDLITSPDSAYVYRGEVIKVTVPEGFSAEMIALRMSNAGLCTYDEFMSALNDTDYDYEFINYITPAIGYRNRLEGFLFPDTYEFYDDVTAHQIVDQMLASFANAYTASFGNNYDNLTHIVTVASLVEREAKQADERAIISGVIHNRLRDGEQHNIFTLDIDASALYAQTGGLYDTGAVNVSFDSPYNTYIHRGLPPGPICNPGIKAIVAAAKPQEHNYYYYHTDTQKNDGSHIFTKTYEEHMSTM